jgi:hypothetical protein
LGFCCCWAPAGAQITVAANTEASKPGKVF